jgi:hypothetical protein
MTGRLSDMVEQPSRRHARDRRHRGLVSVRTREHRVAPLRVWRHRGRQPVDVPVRRPKSRGVRQAKRLADVEPDVPAAPLVVETDIEQMRAERELEHDPGAIQLVTRSHADGRVQAEEEAFGVMVAEAAERALLAISHQRRDAIADTSRLGRERCCDGSRHRYDGGHRRQADEDRPAGYRCQLIGRVDGVSCVAGRRMGG